MYIAHSSDNLERKCRPYNCIILVSPVVKSQLCLGLFTVHLHCLAPIELLHLPLGLLMIGVNHGQPLLKDLISDYVCSYVKLFLQTVTLIPVLSVLLCNLKEPEVPM